MKYFFKEAGMKDVLKKTIVFFIALLILASAPAARAENTDAEIPEEEPGNVVSAAVNTILYVPFRLVAEQLGGIVEYEEALHRIYAIMPDETKISHVLGTNTFVINGRAVSFSLPSLVDGGVTYLPVTVLNTLFKNAVSYDYCANTVNINTGFYRQQSGDFRKLLECRALEHFIPDNLFNYLDYIKSNPEIPADKAAALVNIGAQKRFYSDVREVSDPSAIEVLCNKIYKLPDDYVPEDLVYIPGTGYRLRKEAADKFVQMQEAARSAGIYFYVYSAYRSYDTQKSLFETYSQRDGVEAADTYSARPGHSEHQAGLAVDLMSAAESVFENSDEYLWLINNAHNYGFILRYPEEYTDITGYTFECWHWRYVGLEAAGRMHVEKIATYEEYCGKYLLDIIP